MEKGNSPEQEKKAVRMKLKTDPKQDPKSVKAGGKSALKKEYTPSPDTSVASQQRDSQQSSSNPTFSDTSEKRPSKDNPRIENEAKKNESKDDAEKLAEANGNVVDRKVSSSNLKEAAEKEKPKEYSSVLEDESSTKLNVISPPSTDAVEQEGIFSKDQVSPQESVSTEAPKETAITPKEGEGSISNEEVNVIKEETLSEPLSSNKEEYLVGTSNNENQRSDENIKASNSGNDKHEPNDDPNTGNVKSEANNSGENEIIVSSVHNNDDGDGATDTPSTKISIKVRKKTNEDLEQSVVDGKSENNQATGEEMRTDNFDKTYSDISTTLNSNSITIQASTLQTNVEEGSHVEEESTPAKETPIQGMKTNSLAETQDNIGNKLHEDENQAEGAKDSVKNDTDKQKDKDDGNDGLRIPLERTSGSEDMKIKEMKKRVRPGNVFVVKGDPDCYTVKWAQQRKILAYKVGSKNTSRFSTVLIETVEQLERASVRHPSIISELTHPTTGAKGSLLSAYFAGADARRSIKDNLIREVGTNTSDDQNGFQARQQSPDYNFFAKDHISPDAEVFGGVVPNQPTTADPIIQPNNYNYPFLTDYDVNHERKGDK